MWKLLAQVVESTLLCVRTWVRVLWVPLECYLIYAFCLNYILNAWRDDKFLKL